MSRWFSQTTTTTTSHGTNVVTTNMNGFGTGFMNDEGNGDSDLKMMLDFSKQMKKKKKAKRRAKKKKEKILEEKRRELERLKNEKRQREKEEERARTQKMKEEMEKITAQQLELQRRQSSLEMNHKDSDRTVQEQLRSLSNSMDEIVSDHIDVKNLVSVLQSLEESNRQNIGRNRDDITRNTNQIGVNMAKIQENERRIENVDRQLEILCELRETLRLQSGQSEVTSQELVELRREFVAQMALIQGERENIRTSVRHNEQLIRETREVYGGQLQRNQTMIEDEVVSLRRQVTEIQTDLKQETKASGLAVGVRPGTNVSAMGRNAGSRSGRGVSNGFAGATFIPVQDDRKLRELQNRIDSLEKANSDINDKFILQDAMMIQNDREQSQKREKMFETLLAENEVLKKELEENKRAIAISGVTELSKRIKESEEEVKELREIYGDKFEELQEMVQEGKLEMHQAGEAIQLLGDKFADTTREQEELRARQDQLEENFERLSEKPEPTSDSDNLREQIFALAKRQEEFEEDVKSKFDETIADQNAFQENVVHAFENVANMRDCLMQKQKEMNQRQNDFEDRVNKKFESVDEYLDTLTKRFDAESLQVSNTLMELNKAKQEQGDRINEIKATIEDLENRGPGAGNEPQDSISELRTSLLKEMKEQAAILQKLEETCATKQALKDTATAFNDLIVDENDLEDIQKKMAGIEQKLKEEYATKQDLRDHSTQFNEMMADDDDLEELSDKMKAMLKKMEGKYEELSVDANTSKKLLKDMVLRQKALETRQEELQKQFDSVGDMIDEELKKSESNLKTFFGRAFQKLPRPTAFAEKKKYGGLRTRITVKFQCPCGCSEEFHFKTYHYDKWFKFALIGFKTLISLQFLSFPGITIHKAFEDIKATRKGEPLEWMPGEDMKAPEEWLKAQRLWPQERDALETELLGKVGKLYRSNGNIEEVKFYDVMNYNADWMWFLSNSPQHSDIQPPDRHNPNTLAENQHALPVNSYALRQGASKSTSTKSREVQQRINPSTDVVDSITREELNAAQLTQFLRFAKREDLIDSWVEQEIDLNDLIQSEELDEDLKMLGISKAGPRLKLWKAMKKWKKQESQELL